MRTLSWSHVLFVTLLLVALAILVQSVCSNVTDADAAPAPAALPPALPTVTPAEVQPRPAAPPVVIEDPPLLGAVQTLQPVYRRENRVRDGQRIATIIEAAAERNRIDPLLATAIAMRESSLRGGRVVGSLGEEGLFQVMPSGYARRACPRSCDLSQPRCNAEVALCYLAHVRELCPGSTWRWVAAYGMRRCPSEREARTMTTTRRARAFLVQAAGAERAASVWPEG